MQKSKLIRLGKHILPFGASGAYVGWFIAKVPGAIIGGLAAVIYRGFTFQMHEKRGGHEGS
jgi:hypothetical protein